MDLLTIDAELSRVCAKAKTAEGVELVELLMERDRLLEVLWGAMGVGKAHTTVSPPR